MSATKLERRSHRERSEHTRAALIEAARGFFVAKGYADTGTPEIVAAANLTRGALYHHFADKRDLFRAVVEHEAAAVAEQIRQDSGSAMSACAALCEGADAYFSAMAKPGRTRLLLVDAASVLGQAEADRIDRETSWQTLREGLAQGMADGELTVMPLDVATTLLSAAFDRAALDIAGSESSADYRAAIRTLIEGLTIKSAG